MKKKILICGCNSYAASGLADALRVKGHAVIEFDRGDIGKAGEVVLGPVMQMDQHPRLQGPFDVVINYILIKDGGVEENIDYMRTVLRLCRRTKTSHLIHISSVSIFKASETLINEDAEVETNPDKLGPYAAQKLAVENDLVEMLPKEMNLSLVRPGFILGEGLADPIIAAGMHAPMDSLVAMGNASSQIPLISRDLLNQSLVTLVADPPKGIERLVMVSRQSPTKMAYLRACNSMLGVGKRTIRIPQCIWLVGGLMGEALTRARGKRDKKILAKIMDVAFKKSFDSTLTEKRVGFTFDFDWKQLLEKSVAD